MTEYFHSFHLKLNITTEEITNSLTCDINSVFIFTY